MYLGFPLCHLTHPNGPQCSVPCNNDSVFGNGHSQPLAPIGSKPRHYSGNTLHGPPTDSLGLCGSLGGGVLGSYHKAPGSEREDRESQFKKQLAAIDSDPSLDLQEKNKRKQSLFMANVLPPNHQHPPVSLSISLPSSSYVSSLPSSLSSTVSPLAQPFYPTSDTVESVVGKYWVAEHTSNYMSNYLYKVSK